jgi:mRNA-degrading endonuclease toxin of MazEF toxin-antitoxin module
MRGEVHLVQFDPTSGSESRFQQRSGFVVLDQLRTVERERLVTRLGALSSTTLSEVLGGLQEMFAE